MSEQNQQVKQAKPKLTREELEVHSLYVSRALKGLADSLQEFEAVDSSRYFGVVDSNIIRVGYDNAKRHLELLAIEIAGRIKRYDDPPAKEQENPQLTP